MFKHTFVSAVLVALVACGGGGGGGQPDDELQFGQTVPSEVTLCGFTIGVTTRDQIEAVLGEPTSFADDPSGSTVQYWYGNAAISMDLKILVLSFGEEDVFEFALTTQIPYPQCWRDQEQDDASTP